MSLTPAFAEEQQGFSFNGYARAGFQVGKSLEQGDRVDQTGGFMKSTRLLEGSYFEISLANHMPGNSHFKFTFAYASDLFHYTNVWAANGIVIRDLYYEMKQLPANEKFSLWAGSRMYRGDDIYLYDNWFLDNHNFLGAGMAYHGPQTIEFAIGAKKGSGLMPIDSPSYTYSYNSQRFIVVNKVLLPQESDKFFKTNIEFQVLPASTAKYNGTDIKVPATYGMMAGAQYGYLKGHNAFLNYGYGDVTGGVENAYGNVTSVTTVAGQTLDGVDLHARRTSQNLDLALGGSEEMAAMPAGLLYGALARVTKPQGSNMGMGVSGVIRPMYYMDDHFHAGVELNAVLYGRTINSGDINYYQVSPMLEYALNRNAYGTPKFRVILANAFYSKETVKYGSPTKYAFTLAGGFEVWF
jgi:maltoporin